MKSFTPSTVLRHILVVDDDEAIVSAVAQGLPLLLGPGTTVSTARSGEQARRLLEDGPAVDVVFSDARMPGLAGLDLLAWMKARKHPARRVLVSGYGMEAFPPHELARAAPVQLLTKPVSLAELARVANGHGR